MIYFALISVKTIANTSSLRTQSEHVEYKKTAVSWEWDQLSELTAGTHRSGRGRGSEE